jgi:hypothetical protein
MKTNFTLLLIIICAFSLKAQLPVLVDLDLKSNVQLSSLPFDRPVILKMKPPGEYIQSVGLMQLKGSLKRQFNKELVNMDEDKFNDFITTWKTKNNYNLIPEIPEKNFAYKYYETRSDENDEKKKSFYVRIEGLKEYKYDLGTSSAPALMSKKMKNEKKTNKFIAEIKPYYLQPKSQYILLIGKEATFDFEKDLNDNPQNFNRKNEYYRLKTEIQSKQENIVQLTDEVKRGLREIIWIHALAKDIDGYSPRIKMIFKDSMLFKIINKLTYLDKAGYKKIVDGADILTETNYTKQKLKDTDILTNSKTNFLALESLKFVFEYLSIVQGGIFEYARNDVQNIYDDLKFLYNKRTEKIELKNEMIKEFYLSNNAKPDLKYSFLTTDLFNFETRGKFAITPEFGYIVAGLKRGQADGEVVLTDPTYYLSPYLGFHINFRYWDKNLPFWGNPNHKLINHFSGMIGYTLNKIDSKTNTDFFTNGRSLLLGAGFRLGNAARVVSGILLSNQINTSKTVSYVDNRKTITETESVNGVVKATSIVYDKIEIIDIIDRKVKPTFFVGLSLDLSLKPILGIDITELNPVKWFKNSSNGTPR